jgi:hypothetical protein
MKNVETDTRYALSYASKIERRRLRRGGKRKQRGILNARRTDPGYVTRADRHHQEK